MKGITPPSDEWNTDHIIPKVKGGDNSIAFYQLGRVR